MHRRRKTMHGKGAPYYAPLEFVEDPRTKIASLAEEIEKELEAGLQVKDYEP